VVGIGILNVDGHLFTAHPSIAIIIKNQHFKFIY